MDERAIMIAKAISCEKEMRRDGKKEDQVSVSVCGPNSHFFFMPLSSCFRY
jgi:hypothetical protein